MNLPLGVPAGPVTNRGERRPLQALLLRLWLGDREATVSLRFTKRAPLTKDSKRLSLCSNRWRKHQ